MNVDDYLQMPYHLRLQPRDDGDGRYWLATVEELPGCMSDGATMSENPSRSFWWDLGCT